MTTSLLSNHSTYQEISLGRHLMVLPVSTYVTEGIAKIAGFEVLRHGTSFPNYLNILKNGTDPLRGGSTSNFGAEADAFDPTYRRFHVFRDSDNQLANRVPVVGHIFKRVMPRVHATISGVSYVAARTNYKIISIVGGIFSGIAHLFLCPTMRFVYRKEELKDLFENDNDYGNLALKTYPNVRLSNDRIGLMGLCQQVTKEDIKSTFQEHPFQFLMGIIQLLVGIIFTTCGVGLFL